MFKGVTVAGGVAVTFAELEEERCFFGTWSITLISRLEPTTVKEVGAEPRFVRRSRTSPLRAGLKFELNVSFGLP